ncbi:hypothetical protein V4F39_02815 [Aquincola sp. MAHUQ-54]|uniref:Uncharacterized protein n=1 Tax=Aquincola agrisoli TaxID=3119538 RepID=A0AAW9Q1L3_9BURK
MTGKLKIVARGLWTLAALGAAGAAHAALEPAPAETRAVVVAHGLPALAGEPAHAVAAPAEARAEGVAASDLALLLGGMGAVGFVAMRRRGPDA